MVTLYIVTGLIVFGTAFFLIRKYVGFIPRTIIFLITYPVAYVIAGILILQSPQYDNNKKLLFLLIAIAAVALKLTWIIHLHRRDKAA